MDQTAEFYNRKSKIRFYDANQKLDFLMQIKTPITVKIVKNKKIRFSDANQNSHNNQNCQKSKIRFSDANQNSDNN